MEDEMIDIDELLKDIGLDEDFAEASEQKAEPEAVKSEVPKEKPAQKTVKNAEHNGRLRKYYHITELGLKRIDDFKEEWKEILSIYEYVTREEKKDDQE